MTKYRIAFGWIYKSWLRPQIRSHKHIVPKGNCELEADKEINMYELGQMLKSGCSSSLIWWPGQHLKVICWKIVFDVSWKTGKNWFAYQVHPKVVYFLMLILGLKCIYFSQGAIKMCIIKDLLFMVSWTSWKFSLELKAIFVWVLFWNGISRSLVQFNFICYENWS